VAGQLRRVEITGGLAARDEEARSGRGGHAGAVYGSVDARDGACPRSRTVVSPGKRRREG
jgi:hypothetical protein